MPKNPAWDRVKAALGKAANTLAPDTGGFRQAAKDAGGFDNLGTVVDEARMGGPTAKSISKIPKGDLSKVDRYAHGANAYRLMPPVFRDTPLAPAAVGAIGGAYELSKALPAYFGDAVAAGTDPSYAHDSNTSQPSFDNVLNLLRGYQEAQGGEWAGRAEKLLGQSAQPSKYGRR